MIVGTTTGATSFVSVPKVELPAPPDLLPKVDLYNVAYYRDKTEYDLVLKSLLQKVSEVQKRLAALNGR